MEKESNSSGTFSTRKENGNIQITPKGKRHYVTTTHHYATTPPYPQGKSFASDNGQSGSNTPARPSPSMTTSSSKKMNSEKQTNEMKTSMRASQAFLRNTPVHDKSTQQSVEATSTHTIAETPKKVKNGQQKPNMGKKNKGDSSVEQGTGHLNMDSEGNQAYNVMQGEGVFCSQPIYLLSG
jgi:hypothetical protein